MRKTCLAAMVLTIALSACQTSAPAPDTDQGIIPVEAPDPTGSKVVNDALERYNVERHFTGDTKDTLLANMVTFIYKRPTAAINRDRTEAQFRPYYVKHAAAFNHLYHHVDGDSTHWYYLIRPARSVEGDKRGVGGRFRTNDQLEMVEFEEIFNTRILPEQQLIEQGAILFEEMVATGNVDAYLENKELIEWPDGRLFYSKEKREWRYVD
jgi:hypothetical protein